jgi:tRNA U34 5-methylaminomethyl-2-thiouridine-forming methyltransferase MnmC
MEMREISQGDLRESRTSNHEYRMTPVTTADGSVTFFSNDWKEHYHTKTGARLEAQQKFVVPSGLDRKLQTANVQLLDVCFGLGNNSLAALCAAAGAPHRLAITALEMDKRVVRAAAEFFQPLETDPVDWKTALAELLQHTAIHLPKSTLSLRWGDARWLVQGLENETFDLIFHDSFSSQHCPELWTVEFFQQLYRVMKPDGVLLTYSSALPVRGALRAAGFVIGETQPKPPMGRGTIAAKNQTALDGFPLLETLQERRSLPYRDPFLCATSKAILRARQDAVAITNR